MIKEPSTSQRMTDNIFGVLEFVKVYFDDVVIFSTVLPTHIQYIEHMASCVSARGRMGRLGNVSSHNHNLYYRDIL